MGDHTAATQPEDHKIELGSLAGQYSTANEAAPWWVSAPMLITGVALWVVLDADGWVHYVGHILIVAGAVGLGQRFALRATTQIAPEGLCLRGYYGRRRRVPWAQVAEVLPSRFSGGRSRVRLANGRRVLLGGVPVSKARRLGEVLRRAGMTVRCENRRWASSASERP